MARVSMGAFRKTALAVTLVSSSVGGVISASNASAAPAPIKIGLLNHSTGEYGSFYGPLVPGVQAWANWVNSHGGIDGHQVSLDILNSNSNPSQVVSNAHLAVAHDDVAIIQTDPLFDSVAPYYQSVGIPVYGFGITPGFYGPTNFFSFSGNVVSGKATGGSKFLISKGRKKFAAVSDASPADAGDIKASVPIIKASGGTIVYQNYNVDVTNTASMLSVAQAIKNSGAQVVQAATLSTEAQLQVDLAQVGAGNVWVASGNGYQQDLPQQFGPALNNFTFSFFTAPMTVNTPGMKNYLAAMKKWYPKDEYNSESLIGWVSAALIQGGVDKLGSQPVTRASLVKATNTLTDYTGNGVLPPVSFPAFHTEATNCFAFVQVQNQKWVQISGNKTNPFFCSQPQA